MSEGNRCSICGRKLVPKDGDDSDTCWECDRLLLAEENAEYMKKKAAWGEKHKCNECGAPLPLSRRFNCELCVGNEGDVFNHPLISWGRTNFR